MARVANVGASDGIRTRDGRNHNPGLYQLSYARHRGPAKLYRKLVRAASLVRPEGLEPPTGGLEIRCSIRLSYGRIAWQPQGAPSVLQARIARSACLAARQLGRPLFLASQPIGFL